MRKIYNITLVLLLVLVLGLSSCGKNKLKDVTFKNAPTTMYVGEEVTLEYELQDKASIEWSSSNNKIAEVENGKITALEAGNVTIKAVVTLKKESKEYTFDITVKQNGFNVTYENDGTYSDKTNPNAYSEKDLPIVLVNPTKVGFTFLGWYLNNELVTEIPTGTTGDVTVVAQWEATSYNITYNLDGGINSESNPDTYTVEDEVVLSAPTKEGFAFLGWYINDELVTKIAKGTTGDVTLVAKWEAGSFNIIYNLDGGVNNEANPSVFSPESDVELSAPTKNGYNFLGWYLNDELVTKIPAGTAGDVTLVAKWEALSYNIIYNLDGGINNEANPTTYTVEDEVVFSAPSKEGYDFLGWVDNEGNAVNGIVKGTTGDKEVYATWEKVIVTLTITYTLNGGKLPEDAPKSFIQGEVVTLPIPTRENYKFLGWSVKLGSTTYYTEIPATQSTNIKYYANWEKIDVYSPIYYECNGGTFTEPAPEVYLEGKVFNLPVPVKDGYNFLGWTLTEESNSYTNVITKNQTGAVTLYAKWELDTSFTITYVYEEGELPKKVPANIDEVREYVFTSYYNWLKPSDDYETFKTKVVDQWKGKQSQGNYQFYKQGGKDTIDDAYFCNASENFKEWNAWFTVFDAQVTAANGAQNAWNSYVGILRLGQWISNSSPSTWKDSMNQALIDATLIPIPLITEYTLGETKDLVELVVDDGRTFLGWYDENGNKVDKITAEMSGDLTLTAKWSASTPADSFELNKVEKLGKLDSYQLTWVLLPAETTNKKIVFTSSDPTILSIDKYAVMHGHQVGKVTVTYDVLANPELSGSFEVEVYVDPYIDATFETTSVVGVGEYIKINAELMASEGKVVWTSKNPSIATVDESGQVYGKSGGYVEIVASMEGNDKVNLVLGITVLTTEDKSLYSVLTNAHNAEVYYVNKLNVAYDYDTSVACSVSDLFFNWEYTVNEKYFITPNRSKMSSIEFITVHYSGMPLAHQDGEIIAQALYNGFHGTNWGGTSWHYSTGNDGIFHSMSDDLVAWHAGDGTGTKFQWLDTGVKATSNTKPVFAVVANPNGSGYVYSVNGQVTSLAAPGNYRLTFYGPTWKIENGKYFMGNTYYNSDYKYISSRGGNLNSIGIETACNLGSDLWMTYHITAQLVSRLLVQNNLETSRIQGHHTFSGKDCPQTLLEGEGELWYKFMELVEAELALYKTMSNYTITCVSSNKDLASDNGRVVKVPNYTETVTYTLTVKNNTTGVTKEIKLSSVIHGLYTLD
ncbi:MAG: InlB B-repeat-containing protein [Bacilli bacterium]|nr:InlB B-repeat-containing protein [Bacilli bacterium]